MLLYTAMAYRPNVIERTIKFIDSEEFKVPTLCQIEHILSELFEGENQEMVRGETLEQTITRYLLISGSFEADFSYLCYMEAKKFKEMGYAVKMSERKIQISLL